MKANELRIGNWIEWAGNNIRVTEICEFIDADAGRQGLNIDGAWLDDCSPIPLTPEILEKVGFEKVDNFYFHPLIGDYSMEAYDDEFIFACDDCFYNVNLKHVKYLHQLQNLYFALTGYELNIDL